MATRYLEHVASDGERWDTLAAKYYSDPFAYVPIVDANPAVPITAFLAAGTRVLIPILESAAAVAPADVPPWKR